MALLTDIEVLRNGDWSKDEALRAFLAERPSLSALVSVDGVIYHRGSEGAQNASKNDLMALSRRVLQLRLSGEARIPTCQPVLDTVFNTFVKEREQALKPVDRQDEASKADELLEEAVRQQASDIHIEAERDGATIYFRVHGRRRLIARDIEYGEAMRLIQIYFASKRYANAEFKSKGVSDAMFDFIARDDTRYTARLNAIVTAQGTKLVCRLRNPTEVMDINGAGYTPEQLVIIQMITRYNEGMVLLCGPTNSGKSTSVTSIVANIEPERCVLELADPIEVFLSHVTHVNLNLGR